MAEVRGVGVPENRQMEANWSIIGQRTGIAVFHPLHTARKSFGFRTNRGAEIALYHALGDLPTPEFTHRFC